MFRAVGVFALRGFLGAVPHEQIEVFALDHGGALLLHLGATEMRQQIGHAEHGVALILADEPAAHLDDRNAQTLIDLLGMFAQAGVTVFLASHRIPRPRHVKVRVIELDAAARRE